MTQKVLIICTGNSCRSQMAEGFIRHIGQGKLEVYSAGIESLGLNPRAVRVMAEFGIDLSHHSSDALSKYNGVTFDYIITVCDHANEVCPVFPGRAKRFHHSFDDPAKATGSEAEILQVFRKVRDEIKDFCREFVDEVLLVRSSKLSEE